MFSGIAVSMGEGSDISVTGVKVNNSVVVYLLANPTICCTIVIDFDEPRLDNLPV